MDKLQQWYDNMTGRQKLLLYAAALCLIFACRMSFIPLVFLLYLQLGRKS